MVSTADLVSTGDLVSTADLVSRGDLGSTGDLGPADPGLVGGVAPRIGDLARVGVLGSVEGLNGSQ